MSSVSIEEARAKLSELIHELHPGDEVVIIKNEQPVAASGVRRRRRGTDDEMLLQIGPAPASERQLVALQLAQLIEDSPARRLVGW